ncbi:M1 family metallopeptidase [Marinigracilibium pacificum]|uniref:M1 family metallopeptidase n=1 Tax=Marinigracilibium pacificum TaxID=2729599 RepID=A0A848IU50_9BACT|nr:M1 family metallopeptidase [Marinigracilibium pacificum]NMM48023.1 M1 family metallopeptidase [Marinigracilibium pacificum]
MKILSKLFYLLLIGSPIMIFGQDHGYWQQSAKYEMNIDMDVNTNQFTGDQTLTYTNNSPDTLSKVFYHLYFNAFQPESQMDVRSRNLPDPDKRVQDRISKLTKEEIGYHEINSLTQDGKKLSYHVEGTVLEVNLAEPILPGASTVFKMKFNSQVPVQIRRSGRDSHEGIRYSMSQWYPKMAEYDMDGWHPDPYIGREFHGVWSDFDVNITIDKEYVLGGSGNVVNGNEVGFGYEDEGTKVKSKGKTKTWHFVAKNVHDFMWAADPDYVHKKLTTDFGLTIHFLYQDEIDSVKTNWEKLPEYTAESFRLMNENFGVYPYDVFSVIQGGDGGMEYATSTLITGRRTFGSLIGVTVHEMVHSWYQGVLATNESIYPWMDEGFTTFASDFVMSKLFNKESHPVSGSYRGYIYLATSEANEPLSTHGDHYETNMAYGINSYSKGAVFLNQLRYIIGEENFWAGMKNYFNTWKFKHPDPNSFLRIMEKQSGLVLDWYLEDMLYTTKVIDYSVEGLNEKNGNAEIILSRKGTAIMPIDFTVTLKNGEKKHYYIPLAVMRGEKPINKSEITLLSDWGWTNPQYAVELEISPEEIESIEIDPDQFLADINRGNNKYNNNKQ